MPVEDWLAILSRLFPCHLIVSDGLQVVFLQDEMRAYLEFSGGSLTDYFTPRSQEVSLAFDEWKISAVRPVELLSHKGHVFSGDVVELDGGRLFMALVPKPQSIDEYLELSSVIPARALFGADVGMLVQLHAATTGIRKHVEYVEEMRLASLKSRESLDFAKVIILRYSAKGLIEYVNKAWVATTGYEFAETIGQPLVAFICSEDKQVMSRVLSDIPNGGKSVGGVTFRIRRRDGVLRNFEFSGRYSELTGVWHGVMVDVTRELETLANIESAQKLAEEAKSLAESSSQAKSLFLAQLSHEIRTPVHVLLGFMELLDFNSLSASDRMLLSRIQSAASKIRNLVSGVLDIAKIEQGAFDLHSKPFSPKLLLENVVESLKYSAQEGVQVITSAASDVPDVVNGDSNRVGQILFNLLENALKYTPSGEVSVDLCIKPQGPSTKCLCFTVSDTGVGVPIERQDAIFQPYIRADNILKREGSGIGLSIVKDLASRLGGTVQMSSRPGQGSVFSFSLPFVPISRAESESDSQSAKLPVRDASILIVEDNRESQLFASLILESAGFVIDTALDGAAAVAAAASSSYDLILMDLTLPDISGIEAASLIKADEVAAGKASTPIIAFTAQAVQEIEAECLSAGMKDFLIKPASKEELLSKANQWTDVRPGIVLVNFASEEHQSVVAALRGTGKWKVSKAMTLETAIPLLDQKRTALVLVSMDGLSLDDCGNDNQFRQRTRPLPIVGVASVDTYFVQSLASELGCVRLLVGPLDNKAVIQAVSELLKENVQEASNQRRPAIMIPPKISDLASGYIEARFRDVTKCRVAVHCGDWKTVRVCAHNMKGTGSSYGFPDVTRFGRDLEQAAIGENRLLTEDLLRDFLVLLSNIQNVLSN